MNATRWVLLASLGINLFMVGLWLGSRSDFQPLGPPPFQMPLPRPVTLGERLAHQLSPDALAKVEAPIARLDDVMRQGFEERQATFEKARTLVTAEPYDAAAVRALLDTLPNQRMAGESEQWDIIANILGELTPADRAAFADLVFLRPPSGGPGPHMQGPQGPLPTPSGR